LGFTPMRESDDGAKSDIGQPLPTNLDRTTSPFVSCKIITLDRPIARRGVTTGRSEFTLQSNFNNVEVRSFILGKRRWSYLQDAHDRANHPA
jgi:hypothetical protein